MAIDYVLRMPCDVRKVFAEPKVAALVRQKEIAEFAIRKLREANPGSDIKTLADNCMVEIAVAGPDGTARQMPVTVSQLASMIAPLSDVKDHCKTCRANIADRSFGCIAKVNYPVLRETEAWLLARLPEDENDPDLVLLFKSLTDLEIDGAPVDALRARDKVFEAKAAPFRTCSGTFDRRKITSSQILHMLAFGGTIGPEQARLYTRMLKMESILSEPHPRTDQVEQVKTLFCAVVMTGRLNASIEMDA